MNVKCQNEVFFCMELTKRKWASDKVDSILTGKLEGTSGENTVYPWRCLTTMCLG